MIIILITGLWPFNFFPKNKVEWLPDRNGVYFYGQGIIVSPDSIWGASLSERALTFELKLCPTSDQGGVRSILTIYDGQTPDILHIGQWKSHLTIWSRADTPAYRKRSKLFQEIGARNALMKDREVLITISSGPSGTNIYINGGLSKSYPERRLIATSIKKPAGIILGNVPSGQSYWTGYFSGLAVYERILKKDEVFANYESWMENNVSELKKTEGLTKLYTFRERRGDTISNEIALAHSLYMPQMFKPAQRIILDPSWNEFQLNWSFVSDVSVNILGFIPVGFFFALFLMKRTHLNTIALCAIVALTGFCLSLFIELSQIFLPTRFSQLSDVICNTAGTMLGLILLHLLLRRTSRG